MKRFIPLSIPNLSGKEWEYVQECLDTNWLSTAGPHIAKFEAAISAYTGSKFAVATNSGTSALHISLLLAGVQAGEYVLVPDLTFIASLNAIAYTGAEPLLIDVDARLWQIDIDLIREFLEQECEVKNQQCIHTSSGKRIAALMPVHILGNLCDMDKLIALAKTWHIPVIEDATESLGSTYQGRHAGTLGDVGVLSFNGNKIITTGGGGMILTNDETLAQRAKHLTTQARASQEEYIHDAIGYNYRMPNILAAIGLAQLEQLPGFMAIKQQWEALYRSHFSSIEGLRFQEALGEVQPNHWLITPYLPQQGDLQTYLADYGIQVRRLWEPMHRSQVYRHCRFIGPNEISTDLYQHCWSLPSSSGSSEEDIRFVIEKITDWLKKEE